MIFPIGMFLRENKRLKRKKDKETLKRFKHLSPKPLADTLKRSRTSIQSTT